MRFSASLDRTTKIVSAGLCVGLAVLWFVLHVAFLGLLIVPIVLLGYAWSPRGYVVANGAITIRRLIGSVTIPLTQVSGARRATEDDLRGCIRLFGSGGLFGYYGKFRTSKLGVCTWYVTNRGNMVVLTGAKTILVSPDDVSGFLAALGPMSDTTVEAAAGEAASNRKGIAAAIGFVALIASGMYWLLSYTPGLPKYTLANGALKIDDRFYSVTLHDTDVNAADAQVVDLATDAGWRPVARTNGFANSHYRSGWFRVANGQKVRLYQADSKRLVLLPGRADKPAVLLQVADPAQFVTEVKQQLR
jgi:hypothetical protein